LEAKEDDGAEAPDINCVQVRAQGPQGGARHANLTHFLPRPVRPALRDAFRIDLGSLAQVDVPQRRRERHARTQSQRSAEEFVANA